MKHLKTRNQLNEASENLNISDVSESKNDINTATNKLCVLLEDEIDVEYSVGSTSEQFANGKIFQQAELIVTIKQKINTDELPHKLMGFDVIYIIGKP